MPKGRVVKINITCSKNSDYQTGQILVKTTGSSTCEFEPTKSTASSLSFVCLDFYVCYSFVNNQMGHVAR